MLDISFLNLLESISAEPDGKNFTGNLRRAEEVLQPATLAMLEERHAGIFAFIAYDPSVDQGFSEYIASGALGGDTGRHVLALHVSPDELAEHTPSEVSVESVGVLDFAVNPSYELVRSLFPKQTVIPPGILVLRKFSQPDEAVFISAARFHDRHQVSTLCRIVFAASTTAWREIATGSDHDFVQRLALHLSRSQIEYTRSGRRSFLEWLTKAYALLWRNRSDLIATASIFA